MNKEKLSLIVALALALGAGGWAIGNHDFWQAEASHALLSQSSLSEMMNDLQEHGERPPLYYLLVKIGSMGSPTALSMRILSLLFTLGAVWMVFRLASLLFCWRTGFVSAALCATSPLWAASIGVTAAPPALDLLLCAALLYTFCRLLIDPSRKRVVIHGLILTAGLYTQPFFLAIAMMEGLFLAVFFRQYLGLWPKWIGAALIAIVLFMPWIAVLPEQAEQRSAPITTVSQGLGMRVGMFMTQLSLGRPWSWYPQTPVISVTPSHLEDPEQARLRPGLGDDDPMPGVIQAFQMIFLAWYSIFAIVGVMAALKMSAWPLPKYLKRRQHALNALNQLRAARGRKLKEDVSCSAQMVPRQSAVLLVFCFLGTLVCAAMAERMLGWTFIGVDMVFISVPFFIMVARGIGNLEWKVMFYGAIAVILVLSLLFGVLSETKAKLTDGVEEAAAFLENQIQGGRAAGGLGDAVVHVNPCTLMPMRCYAQSFSVPEVVLGAPFQHKGTIPLATEFRDLQALQEFGWIWWVRPDVPKDSRLTGCPEYLAFLYSKQAGLEAPLPMKPPASWRLEEEHRFGNINVSLFIRQDGE